MKPKSTKRPGGKHDDAAMDKKLIDAEFKKRGLKKGGKVKKDK